MSFFLGFCAGLIVGAVAVLVLLGASRNVAAEGDSDGEDAMEDGVVFRRKRDPYARNRWGVYWGGVLWVSNTGWLWVSTATGGEVSSIENKEAAGWERQVRKYEANR